MRPETEFNEGDIVFYKPQNKNGGNRFIGLILGSQFASAVGRIQYLVQWYTKGELRGDPSYISSGQIEKIGSVAHFQEVGAEVYYS